MNSKDNPIVSVIIPSYNHSAFIVECVTSVLQQTYSNIELSIIDDGSTDQTKSILGKLQKDHSFRCIFKANSGLISTLNYSIQNINLGKYVCFLASDDTWPLDKIEKQVKYMEENPNVVLSFGNYVEINQNSQLIKEVKCTPPNGNWLEELLLSNFIPAPTTMLKSSVFEKIPHFEPEFIIEDWNMWLRVAENFSDLGYLNEYLAYYRLHQNNFHKDYEKISNGSLAILDRYKNAKNYKDAVALIKLKYIVKSFNKSIPDGSRALAKSFSPMDVLRTLRCYYFSSGPFRKFRLSYFSLKLKIYLKNLLKLKKETPKN